MPAFAIIRECNVTLIFWQNSKQNCATELEEGVIFYTLDGDNCAKDN